MKFTFVFGFRDRELIRVKRCLDSLANQLLKNFEVIFVDYGSEDHISKEVYRLCEQYAFVIYIYNATRGLPWNRSHSLNTGVKIAKGEYIIFGDIDLIYSPNFIQNVNIQAAPNKNLYGNYYRLPKDFCDWDNLEQIDKSTLSSFGPAGRGGVNIIHKNVLVNIGSYDEFYCFWGVEDRDLFHRLTNVGLIEEWLDNQVCVFHQWHPLTANLINSDFPLQWWEEMNIYFQRNRNTIERNNKNWGKIITVKDRPVLSELPTKIVNIEFTNSAGIAIKSNIIKMIFDELYSLNPGSILKFRFKKNTEIENLVLPKSFSVFGFQFFLQSEFSCFNHKLEKYKKEHSDLLNRVNCFIPEQDLRYIFWQVIRGDSGLDYCIKNDKNHIVWSFSKRA